MNDSTIYKREVSRFYLEMDQTVHLDKSKNRSWLLCSEDNWKRGWETGEKNELNVNGQKMKKVFEYESLVLFCSWWCVFTGHILTGISALKLVFVLR